MVTAVNLLIFLTLKACGTVGKQRHVTRADLHLNPGKFILAGAGETIGNIHLIGGQHVNGEVAGLFKDRVAAGAFINAPQYQRRIQ
ncbi:hypothetical protein D3C80_1850140 [compost metagenome]